VDNYLRFYLLYVEPLQDKIRRGLYRHAPLDQVIRWDVILGLQFETLILNNVDAVFSLLSIPPGSLLGASPYFQRKTRRQQACQVDLLIQTKHTIYVCEIKCRKNISLNVIDDVQKKIASLKIPRRFTVRPVLIYEGELSSAIKEAGYFDALLPFQAFLNGKA
jgi:hypothetical protein